MVDRQGQQFGNYRLIRLLGQGAFADVYLAEHKHLETQVAIKVLSMQLTIDDVEHFRAEARTVARLIHPNIVRVFDFEVEDKTPYLAMDYAPAGSLRQRHAKGTQLPLDTILEYIKQIASALQYAHERKIIHRDIKPENMLLGENNTVLLSDFGIAVMAHNSSSQITQNLGGTVPYMAPEQIKGKPRFSSDQYALGITTYEWLCGTRPFHGSFSEVATQHIFTPPPPLREKLPTIPSKVEEVVMVALAKDPKQRFANVREFSTALEEAIQHSKQPLSASTVSEQPALSTITLPLDVSSLHLPIAGSSSQPEPLSRSNAELNEPLLPILPASFPSPSSHSLGSASLHYQAPPLPTSLASQKSTEIPASTSQVSNPIPQTHYLMNTDIPSGQLPSSTNVADLHTQTQQFMQVSRSHGLLQQQDSQPVIQQLTGQVLPQRTVTETKVERIIRNIGLIILLLVLILLGTGSYIFLEQLRIIDTGNTQQVRTIDAGTLTPLSTQTSLSTLTQHPLPLGFPIILQSNSTAVADDNSTYTFTVQTTDQSNGKRAAGNPIHVSGIMCKLWLTKDGNVSSNMPAERMKAVDSLSQPFPGEETGSLDFFDTTTPQNQMCNAKGQGTWNYKVATSVKPGLYFLVILTDWNGVHWAWSWVEVRIKK